MIKTAHISTLLVYLVRSLGRDNAIGHWCHGLLINQGLLIVAHLFVVRHELGNDDSLWMVDQLPRIFVVFSRF